MKSARKIQRRSLVVGLVVVVAFLGTSCKSFADKVVVLNALYGTDHSTEEVEQSCDGASLDAGQCDNFVTQMIVAKLRSPWDHDVERTAAARDCVAGHESINAGEYLAENGTSSASGRYQFLDSTWRNVRDMAEDFYGRDLGSEARASWAPPAIQNVVGAFSLAHPDIVRPRPWPYTECYNLVGN